MAATIKDIAKRLNISVSTVSYALNDGPRTVPEDVRAKVHAVAKEIGYRPNRLARSLATGRTHTIGVVPTEPVRDLTGMNYFRAVFNGIVNAAEDLHQDVMIFTRADASRAEALDTLLDGRVDGLVVLSPRQASPILDKLVDAGIPFATVSTTAPEGYPTFGCDNAAGITLAIDHLIELGHTRIGHLAGSLDMQDGIERRDAFLTTAKARGLTCREAWVVTAGFVADGGYRAALDLLKDEDRPTALVCANDESAHGACRAAAELGLRVPEDLSIVGFDDAEFAAYLTPALTTVSQPFDAMGGDALRGLLDLVKGRPSTSRIYPPRLIVRSSTAPLSNSNAGNK